MVSRTFLECDPMFVKDQNKETELLISERKLVVVFFVRPEYSFNVLVFKNFSTNLYFVKDIGP